MTRTMSSLSASRGQGTDAASSELSQLRIKKPSTSCPASSSSLAATVESTPPDIASATLLAALEAREDLMEPTKQRRDACNIFRPQ